MYYFFFLLYKEKKYNFRNTFFRYDRVITRLQPASMVFKNIFFILGSKIFCSKKCKQYLRQTATIETFNRILGESSFFRIPTGCFGIFLSFMIWIHCGISSIFSMSCHFSYIRNENTLRVIFDTLQFFCLLLLTIFLAQLYIVNSRNLWTRKAVYVFCKLDLIHITITVLCSKWCYNVILMQISWSKMHELVKTVIRGKSNQTKSTVSILISNNFYRYIAVFLYYFYLFFDWLASF